MILDTTVDNFLSSGKPVHLEQLISGHVQVQNDLCSQTRANIDSVAERRAEERSQITATYAETVSKLIHIIGDLERITSEHMYSEQSWVEQLLKRVRNEADSATNEFHAYLGIHLDLACCGQISVLCEVSPNHYVYSTLQVAFC